MPSIRLLKIADNVYYAKGSPASLIVVEGEKAYVVDPGMPKDRGKLLRKAVLKLGVSEIVALLTHLHGDHLLAVEYLQPNEIFIPPGEAFAVKPNVREGVALCYPFHVKCEKLTLFEPAVLFSYKFLESNAGPFHVVDLPGHSPYQKGFLLGNVLYVGDAVFGDKLIARVGVPYFFDHRQGLESMNELLEYAEKGFKLVLSHGPVVQDKQAVSLVEQNISTIQRIRQLVLEELEKRERCVSEIALRILKRLGAACDATSVVLAERTVRSILAEAFEEGIAEPSVSGDKLVWQFKRHT